MSMAGMWCCGNCQIPMDYRDTEMTRCPECGSQMDWFRATDMSDIEYPKPKDGIAKHWGEYT